MNHLFLRKDAEALLCNSEKFNEVFLGVSFMNHLFLGKEAETHAARTWFQCARARARALVFAIYESVSPNENLIWLICTHRQHTVDVYQWEVICR